MQIVLTEEQRLLAEKGQAVEVVDSTTNQKYMVTIRPTFEATAKREIPEGIVVSRIALRRDLPELLSNKRLVGQWVAYHRNERIGISPSGQTLLKQCFDRDLDETEFYIGWIDSSELAEIEEIEDRRPLFDEDAHENS